MVDSHNSAHLTWKSFEAVMEASLYNPDLWASFKPHLTDTELIESLLLEDPRVVIRKSVAKQILVKCTYNPR